MVLKMKIKDFMIWEAENVRDNNKKSKLGRRL